MDITLTPEQKQKLIRELCEKYDSRAPLTSLLMKIQNVERVVVRRALGEASIPEAQRPELEVTFPANDQVIFPLFGVLGVWEFMEVDFLFQTMAAHPGAYTLLDVGANVGMFTLQAFKAQPFFPQTANSTLEHALLFEPQPLVRRCLQDNMLNNGLQECTTLFPIGLGHQSQNSTFFCDVTNTGNNSVFADAMRGHDSHQVEIEIQRFDDLLPKLSPQQQGQNRFLKCDTQGMEPSVLAGFPDHYLQGIKGMVLEVWPTMLQQSDPALEEGLHHLIASFPKLWIDRPIFDQPAGQLNALDFHTYLELVREVQKQAKGQVNRAEFNLYAMR
ncbi:FkbM family methyltransferase [Magnetococcus sp. PR-3]|uniref:FkbM family methyltransferase n=1 Tax=Magnetococcus sp. PR-3 TaxID=3120355 RepID=UPI002FCE26BD